MSGGSYNYMYSDSRPLSSDDTGNIERMARRLRELGHPDAGLRTAEVLRMFENIERVRTELSDIWASVEWIDSNDSAPGDERKAVEEWRAKRPPPDRERIDVVSRLLALESEAATLRAKVESMVDVRDHLRGER